MAEPSPVKFVVLGDGNSGKTTMIHIMLGIHDGTHNYLPTENTENLELELTLGERVR